MSMKRRIAAIEKAANQKRKGKIFVLDESASDYEDQRRKIHEEINRNGYINPIIYTITSFAKGACRHEEELGNKNKTT